MHNVQGNKTLMLKDPSIQASTQSTGFGDFNLYDGDSIPAHEELNTMNLEGLDSNCEDSDDDSSRKRKLC